LQFGVSDQASEWNDIRSKPAAQSTSIQFRERSVAKALSVVRPPWRDNTVRQRISVKISREQLD